MAMLLPGDVWIRISDFVASRSLSLVCHCLWDVLQGRHLSLVPHPAPALQLQWLSQHTTALGTLQIPSQASISTQLQFLCDASTLWLLDVALEPNGEPKSGYEWNGMRWVDSERVDNLDVTQASLLAAVLNVRSLQSLTLDLHGTLWCDSTMHYLAQLASLPCLSYLSLDLRHTCLANIAVKVLVGIAQAPVLADFRLNASFNMIGNIGAAAFVQFQGSPCITALSLCLVGNNITNTGALKLRKLTQIKGLRKLMVDLAGNNVASYLRNSLHWSA